jgi:hypothetical protein
LERRCGRRVSAAAASGGAKSVPQIGKIELLDFALNRDLQKTAELVEDYSLGSNNYIPVGR